MYPVQPTSFDSNPYSPGMYESDFFYCSAGNDYFPDHHCKMTWLKSIPYISNKRNSVDIGCRDGEYSRYLQNTFDHVYCFDYRLRKNFNRNVSLENTTHFNCVLGNENKKIKVSGGGSITAGKIPKERWYEETMFTLDQFKLENIDYIKIDVDGFETKVLQGSIKTLEKYSPLLVLEQEKGDTEAIEFCKGLGYDILDWDDAKRNVIMGKT